MEKEFQPKTYQDYIDSKTIQTINILEEKDIILFHQITYKDNIDAAKFNIVQFPRWSIICAYYAMHDISKLYLALEFNIKFTKPSVHDAVIKALKHLVHKKEISKLIDEGNKEFMKIQRLDYFLAKGKQNREKTQYYSILNYRIEEISKIAKDFLNNIAIPYINIVKKLIKNNTKTEEVQND